MSLEPIRFNSFANFYNNIKGRSIGYISAHPFFQLQIQPKWNRAAQVLNDGAHKIDEKLHISDAQAYLDNFYVDHLNPILQHEKAREFNAWLDRNGESDWYSNLATFVAKLPLQVIRNVLMTVYRVLHGLVFGVVHPLKAMDELARMFINFLQSLTHPETYTLLTAGAIGTSVAVGSNPALLLSMLVVMSFGVGYDAFLASRSSESAQAVKRKLFQHLAIIPEAMLTGFAFGTFSRYFQTKTYPSTEKEAFTRLNAYVAKNNLPKPFGTWYEKDSYIVSWFTRPANMPADNTLWNGMHVWKGRGTITYGRIFVTDPASQVPSTLAHALAAESNLKA